jgi:hypothetical protein
MMDTETREFLTEQGISEANIDGLSLFGDVVRPETMDAFTDDQPCEPITLTAGQVMSLRGALRGQVMAWFDSLQLKAAGLWGGEDRFDEMLTGFLAVENLLAEAWAACKSQDVEVPDEIPDNFTV